MLSQAVGLLACVGAVGAIVLVAIFALAANLRRERRMAMHNPIIQPPSAPPFEEDDFGGVPTTGAVQEYEREYRPDPMIGSSGFATQPLPSDEEPDREE